MSNIEKAFLFNFLDMNESHIKDILLIEKESYTYPWSEKIFYDCLNYNYLNKVLLVNNILIGYSINSIIQDECHIMNICVKKNYRRLGYGRKILQLLNEYVLNIKCKIVFLECRPSNLPAIKLYRSEGFNEIGIRKNYYPVVGGYEDAVMFAKYV